MAHLACPCGNSLWNGCDGDETECYFVEVQFNDLSTEIWKCDVCDRMMVFDDPRGPVSRYMRRIDAESLGDSEFARDHESGICFSNLLFNEVDRFASSNHKGDRLSDYELLGTLDEKDRGLCSRVA